jgi:coenzyme Q-binding protein COQ10
MSLSLIEVERRLPYTVEELARLVSDVRAYPKFIPWVKHLTVTHEREEDGEWRGLGHASVGWKHIHERFATHVRAAVARGEVDVRLADGPFRHLENRWRFSPAPDGGTIVKFWLRYEFKNPVLQKLVAANRVSAGNKIMQAFEKEAHRRFGRKPEVEV